MAAKKDPDVNAEAVDVDVVFNLYNSWGLTAEQVLNGVTPNEESRFSYSNFIEASLCLVWKEKYPGGTVRDGVLEDLAPLLTISDASPRGADEGAHDADEEVDTAGMGQDSSQTHLRGHTESLELELLGCPKLTSGSDIDCPSYVPPGTVSGATNACQSFTAKLTVQAEDELASTVQADVISTFNEAMKDGTMSKQYNGIDYRRVFRVPGHSYRCLGDACHTQRQGKEVSKGPNTTSVVGCVLLFFCFLGAAVYKMKSFRRNTRVEASGGDDEVKGSKGGKRDEKEWGDASSSSLPAYEMSTMSRRNSYTYLDKLIDNE